MKENIEFLRDIVRTPSPDGDERQAAQYFLDYCSKIPGVTPVGIDHFNNTTVTKGSGPLKIMISAHIDELGFLVQTITDNGYVHIAKVGGIDVKVLPGALVQCNGINGIIGKKPIHVESQDERKQVLQLEELLADFGFESKEEAQKYVKIGDSIVFRKGQEHLEFGPSGNYIIAPALDDKLGVYVIAEVLRRVNVPEGVTLYCVAMTQEEVGLRGAHVAARRINPDISVDIDVCPSTEKELKIDPDKYGEIALGKGVAIPYGSDKSRRIANRMVELCEANGIPYQTHVAVAGGTNTSVIQTNALDCETMLLSLPNQNMHTQVEKCCWTDTEACINLITKFIEEQ